VTAILEDGRRFDGDILIGADGIWSKVHIQIHIPQTLAVLGKYAA
jgi:2-polyprenyl-6-methoxyphenol hydroxylase-like FAD-dependent oxidoreductase